MEDEFDDSHSPRPAIRRAASTLAAGVASVIPILGTIWLLTLIYRILRNLGDGMVDGLFRFVNFTRGVRPDSPEAWAFDFPGANLILALLPVVMVFALGFAVTNAPGRRALAWVEAWIERLPILGFIYTSIRQLVEALKGLGGEKRFKGVAYIEYPSPGCRLLGFITGNYQDPQTGLDVTSVFVPTSPNPLTGFVLIIDDGKVTRSTMTLEEASKLIISAGLVAPLPVGELR